MNNENRIWLRRRALQGAPHEVCGFILKDDSIIEIPNSHHEPSHGFVMARHHLIEKVPNPELIQGIWHTHPRGSLRPSKSDIDSMYEGAISKGWDYHIVTTIDIKTYTPESYARKDNSFWLDFAK